MSKRSQSGDVKITRTVSMAPTMKRRSKQYAKIKSKGSAALKSIIKRTVLGLSEKKIILAGGGNVALGSVGGTSPNYLNLCPDIAQGTAQNQRVGNSVRVTGALIRGHFCVLPYNATTNPLGAPALIKVWICRYKKSNTALLTGTDASTGFFDVGSAVTGFSGAMLDMEYYPNEDSWDILETKIFRVGSASQSVSMPVGSNVLFDNSPSTVPFEFNIGKHLRGQCLYNDNTSNVVTNKSLFFVVQPVYAAGNSTTGYSIAEMSYATKWEFIDM